MQEIKQALKEERRVVDEIAAEMREALKQLVIIQRTFLVTSIFLIVVLAKIAFSL